MNAAGFRVTIVLCFVITPCVAQVSRAFSTLGSIPGPGTITACGADWWTNSACWGRCTGRSTCCTCETAGFESFCSFCPAGSHCEGLDSCCPDGKKVCGILCAPENWTCHPNGIPCPPGVVPCGEVCCPTGFVCGPGPKCFTPDQLCGGVPCYDGRCRNNKCCPAAQQCGETDCCAPEQWCLENKCTDCPPAQRCNNGLCCTATQRCVVAVSQGVLDWACCEDKDVCGQEACCRDSACCDGKCCASGKTQCCKDRAACCQKGESCCGNEEACCKPDECCCQIPPLVPPAKPSAEATAKHECFKKKPFPANASSRFITSSVSAAGAASSNVDIHSTLPTLVRFESWPVGQGDASVIVCDDPRVGVESMVIDLGTRGGARWTAQTIKARLLPLNPRVVIVSHPDDDHYSYLPDVFDDAAVLPLHTVLLGGNRSAYNEDMKQWLDKVENHGVGVRMLNRGYQCLGNAECGVADILDNVCAFAQPRVAVEVLLANLYSGSSNSDSAIVKVVHGATTMLFPGDFENKSQTQIGAQDEAIHLLGPALQSAVYKVAHHGASRLANYGQFLMAIRPNVAVFSSAHPTTQYHHPRCDVYHNLMYSVGSLFVLDPPDWPSGFACYYDETNMVHEQKQGQGPCHALYSTTPAIDRLASVVVYSSGTAYYVEQQLYPAGSDAVDLEGSAPSYSLAVQ